MATTVGGPAVPCPPKDIPYALAPDVFLVPEVDGTARLIDLGGHFYGVSAVGAEMLRETFDHGAEEAARRIARRWRADPAEVRADLADFLADLVKQGLLHRGRPRRRWGAAAAAAVLWPAILFLRHCVPAGKGRAAALLTLARLSFRCFGWPGTVAAWKALHRPARAPTSADEWEAAVRAVDAAVRGAAAGCFLAVECKERALCCWSLARWAGLPADLVVGVHLFPLAGHCWCESGPWTLSDDRERCGQYQALVRYV